MDPKLSRQFCDPLGKNENNFAIFSLDVKLINYVPWSFVPAVGNFTGVAHNVVLFRDEAEP